MTTYLDTGDGAQATAPPNLFYAPTAAANFYAAYLHRSDVSLGGLAYGFAYDDQGGFSTNIFIQGNGSSLLPSSATLDVTITLADWTSSSS